MAKKFLGSGGASDNLAFYQYYLSQEALTQVKFTQFQNSANFDGVVGKVLTRLSTNGSTYTSKTYSDLLNSTSDLTKFLSDDGVSPYVLADQDIRNLFKENSSEFLDLTRNNSYDLTEEVVRYDPPQESTIWGVYIGDSGTKMYIIGQTTNIHQYTLTTPYDITTAVYVQQASPTGSPAYGFTFNPDGTKYYYRDSTQNSRFYEVTLTVPWDISTQGTSTSVSTSSIVGNQPIMIRFTPDGTKAYIFGGSNTRLYEIDCPTPYSIIGITSASKTIRLLDENNNNTSIGSMFYNVDGTKVYFIRSNGFPYYLDLNTPYILPDGNVTLLPVEEKFQNFNIVYTCDFYDSGTKLIGIGTAVTSSNAVTSISISTPYDIETSKVRNYSGVDSVNFTKSVSNNIYPRKMQYDISADRMYMLTDGSSASLLGMVEYLLATHGTIDSTYAVITTSLDSTYFSSVRSFHYSHDRDKLYVLRANTNQFELYDANFGRNYFDRISSIKFNITGTTPSPSQAVSYNTSPWADSGVISISLSNDLSKVFMLSTGTFERIFTTNVTPGTLSNPSAGPTLSLNSSYNFNAGDMIWAHDGKTLYVSHQTGMVGYELSVAWDLSTATLFFDRIDSNLSATSGSFSKDGKFLYLCKILTSSPVVSKINTASFT